MLHTFAREAREDLAHDVNVILEKELPEVTGWRTANDPAIKEAIARYNESKRKACLERQLARLSLD